MRPQRWHDPEPVLGFLVGMMVPALMLLIAALLLHTVGC